MLNWNVFLVADSNGIPYALSTWICTMRASNWLAALNQFVSQWGYTADQIQISQTP